MSMPPTPPTPPAPLSPTPPTQPAADPAAAQPTHPVAPHALPLDVPQATTPRGRGIGIAALIVGIASIVLSVGLGFLLGIVAIILGILSRTRPAARGLGIGGIVTGAAGLLLSILTTAIAASLLLALAAATPAGSPQGEDTPAEQQPAAAAQTVETACYSFDGPAHYTPNTSATASDACFNTLQLWGELQDDGSVLATGAGAIWGEVNIEAVRRDTFEAMAPTGTMAEMLAYLEPNFFEANGEVVENLTEPTTLDGAEANITTISPDPSTETRTRVMISVIPPEGYRNDDGEVGFFLVTVWTSEDGGDDLVQQVIDSWRWS
jgi:hypothetical protein